jgi:hypothetical protein
VDAEVRSMCDWPVFGKETQTAVKHLLTTSMAGGSHHRHRYPQGLGGRGRKLRHLADNLASSRPSGSVQ